ncbi:MAG: TlpA disulfide reductase family protein [Marinilabilia sp.]
MIIVILAFFGHFDRDVQAQNIPEMDFEAFEPLLHKSNDTTYVVNFWATWCKPCVEEIPAFLEVASEFDEEKVKFVFVSLDLPDQKENRVIPFMKKHGMEDEKVILLNDPDSNSWIDKVNPGWSGAIPATVIYNADSRKFVEGSLTYTELKSILKTEAL